MFIKFRRTKISSLNMLCPHEIFVNDERSAWVETRLYRYSKQASNVYLLTQVGIWAAIQLMWTCGLEAPEWYSGTNILGTHLPTPRWTAELAGGYMCKQFQRVGSNPVPPVSQICALTARPHWPLHKPYCHNREPSKIPNVRSLNWTLKTWHCLLQQDRLLKSFSLLRLWYNFLTKSFPSWSTGALIYWPATYGATEPVWTLRAHDGSISIFNSADSQFNARFKAISSIAKYSGLIVLTIRFISIFLNCHLKYSSITLLKKENKYCWQKTSEIYHLIPLPQTVFQHFCLEFTFYLIINGFYWSNCGELKRNRLAWTCFLQETTPSFIEYYDPGKYLEHCYINVVMHFYMNNHILT